MNFRILPVILSLMLMMSCTVYREYTIDVYRPGKVKVSPGVKNAAVIYRHFNYPGDTLQHVFRKENQLVHANDPDNLDSLLVSACLDELAVNLKNHQVFREVPVFPYGTFDPHAGEKLSYLPMEVVRQLTKNANADLLISLETFSAFFSTFPETFNTPLTNEVVTVSIWGVYDPGQKTPPVRKTLIDTLYWNGYDDQGNQQQNSTPPPRPVALRLAASVTGENFAKEFYANWQTEKRMYSIPPLPDFSAAAQFFEKGKWDEAIFIWEKYAGKQNGKMAIDARYNLALAYEMKDDLASAIKWLNAAHELAKGYRSKTNLEMIRLYQTILQRRLREISLIEQMNNENPD